MDLSAQTKRLYRSSRHRMFAGVLGGMAEFFNLDPTWVRLFFILGMVLGLFSLGVVFYLAAWFIIPLKLPYYE